MYTKWKANGFNENELTEKAFLDRLVKPRQRSVRYTRLYQKYDGKCSYCDRGVSFRKGTQDHVVPVSRGGSGGVSNIVLACERCNKVKSDTLLGDKVNLTKRAQKIFYL
jgi:5-methylcytosine-specific restriction endonuclease McrA